MGGNRLPRKHVLIAAIRKANGNVSLAAQAIGCSRTALYDRISADTDLQKAIQECRDRRLDIAEDYLWAAVVRGEFPAIRFFLMTQGKTRGYTERQEVTGANGESITIRFVDPEDHA